MNERGYLFKGLFLHISYLRFSSAFAGFAAPLFVFRITCFVWVSSYSNHLQHKYPMKTLPVPSRIYRYKLQAQMAFHPETLTSKDVT